MWDYGNPGSRYDKTRHNVGFWAIDVLANNLGIKVEKEKFEAIIGEGFYKGEKIILAKPQTYMNLSGESVLQIAEYYKIETKDIIVIYDDIDIDLGSIRIKPFGGTGTHNGMRNIYAMLGDNEFPRVRIGTGKVPENIDLKDFVLMKMSKEEVETIEKVMEKISKAVIEILDSNIEKAMSIFNGKIEE